MRCCAWSPQVGFLIEFVLVFFKDFIGVGEREYGTIGWGEQAVLLLLGELDPWDGRMGRSLGRELMGRN